MTKTLLKVSARYGVIAGILAFILLVILYYLGRHPLLISPLLDFRVLLLGIFIFFALKEFRDYHQAGILYFGQAMLGGLTVILITCVLASLLMLLFGSWEKDFVDTYITQVIAYLETFPAEEINRIGKEIYERNLKAIPTTNISELTETYFMQGMIIGFFVNIIISVILRRQPKT